MANNSLIGKKIKFNKPRGLIMVWHITKADDEKKMFFGEEACYNASNGKCRYHFGGECWSFAEVDNKIANGATIQF